MAHLQVQEAMHILMGRWLMNCFQKYSNILSATWTVQRISRNLCFLTIMLAIYLLRLQMAKQHGICLLTFPPHCSHKLQPLDVNVFDPFKQYYNTYLDSWMLTNPGSTFSLYNVCDSGRAYMKAMAPSNIAKSFTASEIYLFNLDLLEDDEFMSSEVTNRPLDSDVSCQPDSLSPLPLLPKVPPRKRSTTKRKLQFWLQLLINDGSCWAFYFRFTSEEKTPRKRVIMEESDEWEEDTLVSTDSKQTDEEINNQLIPGRFSDVKFEQKNVIYYVGETLKHMKMRLR